MSVIEFFKNKRVLITGGSGFLGKVLIEQLLWTFEIGEIYVLLRTKKGKTPEERIKEIIENSLFDRIRNKNPEAFKKLVPICGDIKDLKLGISNEDRHTIIENVNIVYHSAACVRFDDSLKNAIIMNTRGTREVIDLALQIKNLIAFIHLSTTYCNVDKKIVEEKIYPPHADWRSAIHVAEEIGEHTLDVFSLKYINPLPNTYTFSKSLGEHVVNDMCTGKIPTSIVRPSVGLVKMLYGLPNSGQDYIPVDKVVKIIILATFTRGLNSDFNEVQVYNAACGESIFTNKDLIEVGCKLCWDSPVANMLWYPSASVTANWYLYYIGSLIYQILPSLLVDGILKLTGQKTKLLKIQRKIYIVNMALAPFTHNNWSFVNDKTKSLSSKLLKDEVDLFYFNDAFQQNKEDKYKFYQRVRIGTLKVLFNEELDRVKGLRHTWIMWFLDRILHLIVFGIFCWYLIAKVDIFQILNNKINDFLLYLNNL